MVVDRTDLVISVDVPAKVAAERMAKRGDPDIFDKVEIMERNREGYKWYMENSGDKCVWVDGDRTREQIHQDIVKILKENNLL